ncbi:Rdx family protein [Myxococcota bacterium]|nr:Rdx family protein [Myxococcota bacterium]
MELIRGKGGNFIVVADGKTVWHRRQMGDEFPSEDKLVAQLKGG